jgi:hypothetical protein
MRAHEFVTEHRLVFKRNARTGKLMLAWRCESGPRSNRTVPNVADCGKAPDVAQAQRMKKTRARTKVRQARRTKRTKRINPASKLITRLNIQRKKK